MGYVIKMPKLGLEMEVGIVLEWRVAVGDAFEAGDVLAEVESEKSIGEVEAREAGTLRRVYIDAGGEVPPGTPIGIVAGADADIADLEAEAEAELDEVAPDVLAVGGGNGAGTEAAVAEVTAPEGSATADDGSASDAAIGEDAADVRASPRAERRAEELDVDLAAVEGTGFEGAVTEADVEAAAEAEETGSSEPQVKASPRAKQRAEELDVDLAAVEGTGFEGAVTETDVEGAAEAATEPEVRPAASSATETAVPPSSAGVRRIAPTADAADRYARTTVVADPSTATALFGTVAAVRAAFEERVTMTDVLLLVASAALADRPVLNGTYAESTHQVHRTQDVAFVADGDGGPVADVVPDLANRSLSEIVEARRNAVGDPPAERATFTLANADEVDGDGRLVNPPAVAALEVDPTGQRAIPDGDVVDLQPLVTAGLTYDTRAVGEAEARAFLERFFELAADASALALESYHDTA